MDAQAKVQDAGYSNVMVGGRHVLTAELFCGKGYVAFFDFTLMWRGSPVCEGGEESPPTGFTPNGHVARPVLSDLPFRLRE